MTHSKDIQQLLTKRTSESKKYPFGVVTWFRVFLWWGTQIVRQVFHVKRPKAEVVRVSHIDYTWPVSSWVFSGEKVYGIFFKRNESKIRVYEFPELEKN